MFHASRVKSASMTVSFVEVAGTCYIFLYDAKAMLKAHRAARMSRPGPFSLLTFAATPDNLRAARA